ncbi:ZIP family metal transporter [Effusibacillus consociatus]|uniref:ZIP family metal transporter n=1 Tax=Effusibacillus consociatus TaxID=1117041 RepID=A0ABV9Q1F3_9BACL
MQNRGVWIALGLLPLILLAGLIGVFVVKGTGIEAEPAAPVEVVEFQKVVLTPGSFDITLRNSGPGEVTIAQVMVDDAVWNGTVTPSQTIPRLGTAQLQIPYPWVEGDPYEIKLITSNGLIFTHEIPVATATPEMNGKTLWSYGLVGLYVGVVPVALGLLWFPFVRRLGKQGMHFLLAITIGLLIFLLIDTTLEAWEEAAEAPLMFATQPLVILIAFGTFLLLQRLGESGDNKASGLRLSFLIALSIGLHNLGEGLAIDSSFAAGEAALGTFLIIGFTLHNITEGLGIIAPLANQRPPFRYFVLLALLAGGPAILGTWIGGAAVSPLFIAICLAIGAGAILQVIVAVSQFMRKEVTSTVNWLSWSNLSGVGLGLAIMYVTKVFI